MWRVVLCLLLETHGHKHYPVIIKGSLNKFPDFFDALTEEDFHGAFQKLLERYNKGIAAGGDYFKGDLSVHYQ